MAPLPKQVMSAPISGTVDTKTDPKQLEVGSLAVCENFDFDSVKQLIQKRGHATRSKATISGGSVGDVSTALVSRNGQALLLTPDTVYADTGTAWAAGSGNQTRFTVSKRILQASITSDPYVAYTRDTSNEYFAYADGANNLVVEARSLSTGGRIFRFSTGNGKTAVGPCWAFVSGGYLAVVFSSGTVVSVYTVNLTTYATATTSIATSVTDRCAATLWRSTLAVGAVTGLGGITIKTSTAPFTSWTATTASYPAAATGGYYSLSMAPYVASNSANDRLFVMTSEGSLTSSQDIYYRSFNAALTSISSGQILDGSYSNALLAVGQATFGATDVMTFTYSGDSAGAASALKVQTASGAGTLVGVLTAGYDRGQSAYLPATTGGTWFSDYLFINPHAGASSYLANRGTEHFPSLSVGEGTLRAYGAFTSDTHGLSWAGSEQIREVGGGYYETNVAVYTLTLDTTEIGPSVEVNKTRFFPGACLHAYDGGKMFEGSFVYRPKLTVSTSSTGGSIGAGTYQYVGVYEWFDSNGNLYRSSPSDPVSKTTTGSTSSATATGAIVSTGMEPNASFVSLVLYRTKAGGSVFYRVGASGFDSLSDTDLGARELIYTTGGVLEAATAPASTFVLTHQGRVFLIDAEDSSRVGFSKKIQPQTAPEFNEDLEIRVPTGEGGLVALGSLDDKLCFFKPARIFVTTGDGPTDTGDQDTFTEPQRIETDVGCSTPRGIVNTNEGVIFKSSRGWYLLNRALQPMYIGAPVERYNSETPTDSLLVTSRNQVRIYHRSGVILAYDYLLKQWAVHSVGSAIKSATLVGNDVWILTDEATQRLLIETTGQWLDGSTFNQPRLVTAWIATAQVQGFQRIYEASIFGELRAHHQLRVRVGYDYDPLWKEEHTIDSDTALTDAADLTDSSYYGSVTALGGAPAQILQYKIKPYIQKCQAVRFEVTVLNPDVANSELARIAGLALTVGLKSKVNRTASEQVSG